jgi:hypothetical protein
MARRTLSPALKALLAFATILATAYALAAFMGEGYGSVIGILALAAFTAAMTYGRNEHRGVVGPRFMMGMHPDAAAVTVGTAVAVWGAGWFFWFPTTRAQGGFYAIFAIVLGVMTVLTQRDRRWRARGIENYPARWLTDDRWVLGAVIAFAAYSLWRVLGTGPSALKLLALSAMLVALMLIAMWFGRTLRKARREWRPL